MEIGLVVSNVLLWLLLLFNLALTLALVRRINDKSHSSSSEIIGLETGQAAPDFSAQTLDGEKVTLSTYTGRKVAFIFISTTCAPCRTLLPELQLLGPQSAQKGVDLILICGDSLEQTQNYVSEQGINLPVLVAPRATNSFMENYKAIATPSFCFIDEHGKIYIAGYPKIEQGEWPALADFWTNGGIPLLSERR